MTTPDTPVRTTEANGDTLVTTRVRTGLKVCVPVLYSECRQLPLGDAIKKDTVTARRQLRSSSIETETEERRLETITKTEYEVVPEPVGVLGRGWVIIGANLLWKFFWDNWSVSGFRGVVLDLAGTWV